jgi:predicted short-subunit dehydrogenase-like oxidoreductase (DUF2520 family)
MLEITVIGNGNVGSKLANSIDNLKEFKLLEWYGRSWINDEFPEKRINKLSDLKKADLYILAVSDNSIDTFFNFISTDSFVVHCSGATSINIFKNYSRSGVLFPVQTISKANDKLFKNTPFCIEAKSENDLIVLKRLVLALKGSYECLNSIQRANLHLSAVWVNNFVNHMIYKGKKICTNNDIPFSILEPIIKNTINQALINDPKIVQTGPAKRGDNKTLKIHNELINDLNDKKLYDLITKSIQNSYE